MRFARPMSARRVPIRTSVARLRTTQRLRATAVAVCIALGASVAVASSGATGPTRSTFAALADAEIGAISSFDHDVEGWHAVRGVDSARATDGVLVVRTNGPDPYLAGPPVAIDAGVHQFLAMRCRANVAGLTQIYFGDSARGGFTEERTVAIDVQASTDFVVYEVDLRRVPGWNGVIDRLRVDPVNGPDEDDALFELDWIAVYQAAPRLVPSLPIWHGPDALVVGFENRGGRPIRAAIDWFSDGHLLGTLHELDDASSRRTVIDASNLPPAAWIEAVQHGRVVWRGRVLRPSVEPGAPAIAPLPAARGSSIAVRPGGAVLRSDADPRRAVRLHPFASATVRGPDEVPTYFEFDTAGTVEDADGVLTCIDTVVDPRIGDVTCTVIVRGTDVETRLTSCADLDVLRLEGPRMIEERPPTHALLPGLEYLEAGETSSDPSWTGTVHGRRERPPAYRVTAPSVSIEYDRDDANDTGNRAWVATMTWADWGRDAIHADGVPAVEFRSIGDVGSFASVFVPARGFRDARDDPYAAEPLRVGAGESLSLRTSFAIDSGTIEDVFERHWIAHTPEPPPIGFVSPHERAIGAPRPGPGEDGALERVIATSLRAYAETLFDGVSRWKTHIAIQEAYADRPEMAAAVVAEAARSQRADLLASTGLAADASVESLLGDAGGFVGPKAYSKAVAAIAAMAPDGGVAYSITPEASARVAALADAHGASGDDLGEVGRTNAGLIAGAVLPLLEYAACTRDPLFVAAAERALARMNSFTVPRGSQTWEIHAETPDLYAAAQCARANVWGWRTTGDERYLDEAQRWIRTGLPFLYWWSPAPNGAVQAVHVADEDGEGPNLAERDPSAFYADVDRPILPFASIPVFGTSWYAVPWFGIPVQWCGLAWANAVRELDAIRPMPEHVRVADGIFRSAANQQCDSGYLAGTLPDSWDLARDSSRQPYIVPERLVEYAYRCLGAPNVGVVQYARIEGSEWTHVATRSLLEDVEQLEGRLSISSRYFAGQDASLILGGTRRPLQSVRVDGAELEPGTGLGQYHWVDCGADRAVLVVRWRSKSTDRIDVEIETLP